MEGAVDLMRNDLSPAHYPDRLQMQAPLLDAWLVDVLKPCASEASP